MYYRNEKQMSYGRTRYSGLLAVVGDLIMLAGSFGVVHYLKNGNLAVLPVNRMVMAT